MPYYCPTTAPAPLEELLDKNIQNMFRVQVNVQNMGGRREKPHFTYQTAPCSSDFLLQEMQLMALDFDEERIMKKANAVGLAREAQHRIHSGRYNWKVHEIDEDTLARKVLGDENSNNILPTYVNPI